jgi:hypothetical protein
MGIQWLLIVMLLPISREHVSLVQVCRVAVSRARQMLVVAKASVQKAALASVNFFIF